MLGIGRNLYGGQKAEQTHAERFAPQAQKLRSAERDAQTRVRANPNNAKAWVDLGMVQLRAAEVDDAIADFRRAAALNPSLAEPQTDLAYALWMRGDIDGALKAAQAALALDPNDASAHRYAGRLLLLRGGDRNEAIDHLEKAARMNPAETDAHFDLVMAYRAAGDAANAWAQVRLLQTEFPEDEPRVLYVQGVLVSDQGRSALAIDFFRKALAGDPHLPGVREALGIELAQNARWTEALDLLESAAKESPQSFRVTYAYALTLMNTQHLAEAEEAARQAIKLNPASSEARALLGQVQARLTLAGGRQP
jgi:tetratricopeptide (TPR) repeat protein